MLNIRNFAIVTCIVLAASFNASAQTPPSTTTQSQPQAQTQPQPPAQPQAQPQPQPQPQAQPQPQPQPQVQPQAQPQTQTAPQAQTQTQPAAQPAAQPQTQTAPQAQTQTQRPTPLSQFGHFEDDLDFIKDLKDPHWMDEGQKVARAFLERPGHNLDKDDVNTIQAMVWVLYTTDNSVQTVVQGHVLTSASQIPAITITQPELTLIVVELHRNPRARSSEPEGSRYITTYRQINGKTLPYTYTLLRPESGRNERYIPFLITRTKDTAESQCRALKFIADLGTMVSASEDVTAFPLTVNGNTLSENPRLDYDRKLIESANSGLNAWLASQK